MTTYLDSQTKVADIDLFADTPEDLRLANKRGALVVNHAPLSAGGKSTPSANRSVLRTAFAFVFGLACAHAAAQSYPSRPIRIVVPYSAGGGVDITARLVGQKLAARLGVGVVVDNRPGAGGIVGTQIVAQGTPDGHTLVLVAGGHAINPSMHRRLPYDTIKDFAPVTVMVRAPGLLIVTPAISVRTVKDFIALARSKRGQLNFASPGVATPPHLAMELLKSMSGIDLLHVPYKGGVSAYFPNVMTGQITAAIPSLASALSLVRGGKLHGLAVTSKSRSKAAPEIPTMIEAGVPDYEAVSWYGMLAPAATPRAIVERLNGETVQILHMDDVLKRLTEQGMEPVGNTPKEFSAWIDQEILKWRRVIEGSGIKMDE